MLWYKLAYRMHRPLQECQEFTTSTEFWEWRSFLQMEEWQEKSKLDYYLAQIAAEIRQFREAFKKTPEEVSTNDLLIPFVREDGKEAEEVKVSKRKKPAKSKKKKRGVEIGPEAMKDPKWRQVNQNAKKIWEKRLGVKID